MPGVGSLPMLRVSSGLIRVAAARRLATQATNQPVKKKLHPIRSFVVKLSLAVTLFYAGGVALSEVNEGFGDIFTEQIPYGEELVDLFESTRYSTLSSPLTLEELKSKFGGIMASRTATVPYEGAKPQIVDPNEIRMEIPGQVEAIDSKKKIEQLKLQTLTVESASTTPEAERFKDIVQQLNNTIESINRQNIVLTEPQAFAIQEAYESLSKKIIDFEHVYQSAVADNVNAQTAFALRGASSEYEKELKEKEAVMTEKFMQEFDRFRAELEQRTSKQLAEDLKANEQTLLAKHANEVALLSITQVKEFNKIIKEKLDDERNGRLAHLEELDKAVNNLNDSVDRVNKFLMKNEALTQLTLTLDELKSKLSSPEAASIKIDPELQKLKSLADLVPGLPKPCCHSKDVQPALLTVALKELNNVASDTEILSNEQLYNRWSMLASDFKTASLLPPNAGILGHTFAKFFSLFLFTKQGTSPTNEDLDNVYAKVTENLRLSKLDEAVEQVVELKGWPHVLCKDWLAQARRRLEVESLISVLDNEVRTL